MKKIIMIILFSVIMLSCDNALMDVYNDRWESYATSESGFTSATNVGDIATLTVGDVSVNMVYGNNQTSITFPTLENDSGTGTITRQFFMGQTEVTNEEFRKVLQWAYFKGKLSDYTGAHNEVNQRQASYGNQPLVYLEEAGKIRYSRGLFTVVQGFDRYPANRVTWFGAIMFCNWLTEMRDGNTDNVVHTNIPSDGSNWDFLATGNQDSRSGYRLPLRKEWEYAARYRGNDSVNTVAGYANPYFTKGYSASGATGPITDEAATRLVAWYSGDPDMGTGNAIQPVMRKIPNTLGLYDMSGSLCEWLFEGGDNYTRYRGGGDWNNPIKPLTDGMWQSPSQSIYGTGFRIVRTK
ncbi:MAG TPA: SUMF1/EgtB/PvdO family nonheme iron enzyme [Spirochaetota bacterium]|nr:SUMF1/EgtB/PvdO family nonheme iron enzyme [Spirochaetota bacterium]